VRLRNALIPAAVAALLLCASADARIFEVTRTGDPVPGSCTPSDCSLREAVQAANARAGADTIVLPNRRRDYKLTIPGDTADDASDGDLDVANDPLAIIHQGRGQATIRGIELGDRLFDVFDTSPLRIVKLRLTGGAVPFPNGDGGAIRSAAPVAIRKSAISGNSTGEAGGAIDTNAALTILRSVVADNESDGQGGAFNVRDDAPLRIVRSVVRGNETDSTGGAIRNAGGEVTILRSRFIGNSASGQGGALRNAGDGPVLIDRSKFNGNTTGAYGGALELNEGETVIRRTTISGNRADQDGAGIEAGPDGVIRIIASTVSRNRAGEDGGGMHLDGSTVTVWNSTFSGNRAVDFGGGIVVVDAADLALNAVSIVRNHGSTDDTGVHAPGGGIFRNTTGTVSVRNTIIALNLIGTERIRDDCAGEVGEPFDSLGNNLISASSSICNGFDEPGDRFRAQPKLGKLKRNGGPTKTVALKQGSPAIGKAHKPSAPNRDQRGRKRDANPDIGAFERGA
jgi:CSLREA domain-containing protein